MVKSKVITHLPVNDNSNGWSSILAPRTARPSLQGDHQCNWVVIGAGYAGLAAARRLAEHRPEDRIILIDAGVVGENASGRNSGFAIDLPHNVGSSMEELEGSHRFMALARAAIDYHQSQIDRYSIQCDWSQPGKYHAAVSAQGVEQVLEPFARELEALGEPYEWIDRDDLCKRLGSPHFTAAVHTPGCRLLNPAALVRGLADNLPENVTLYENSPVLEFEQGQTIRLITPNGQIGAGGAILCVNGFADKFGFYQRRLLNFAANASLSRRLTVEERTELGCEDNWGLTPANAFAGITMRFTRDHRLLIRQNIYFNPSMRESDNYRENIKRSHKKLFDQRFPMLPDVEMEFTWSGYICLSENGSPGFGKHSNNIYSAVCQNAVGVTKGTIGGVLAADLACNQDNELIGFMQSLGKPSKVPPRPFLDIGVRGKFAWELWKARAEA